MIAEGSFTIVNISLFVCLMLAGLAILYALWTTLTVTAFWFVQTSNAHFALNSFLGAGRFPVDVYPGWMRVVFTFLLPVTFITTVPASAAVGHLSWELGVGSLAVAILAVLVSIVSWRLAARSYMSASS